MMNASIANNYRIAHLAYNRFIPAAVSSGGGGGTSLGTLVLDTVAQLRAVTSANAGLALYAVVKGNAAPFDGAGGDYVWDAIGTDADDGLSVIRPNDFTTAGIWRKHV